MGLSNSRLQKIFDENRPIKSDLFEEVVEFLRVSDDDKYWLMTGSSLNAMEPSVAYAGSPGEYDNVKELTEGNWHDVKRMVQSNGHVKIYQVVGDSMAPTLWDNDIVFCVEHNKDSDPIRDTYIYVIESKKHNSVLAKRLVDRGDGTVKLYSDNRSEAKSFILRIDEDIDQIWRIRTKMTWQLGAPSFNNSAIQDIEERLSKLEKS